MAFIFQLSISIHTFDTAHGCLCHNESTGFQVVTRFFIVAAEKVVQFKFIKGENVEALEQEVPKLSVVSIKQN